MNQKIRKSPHILIIGISGGLAQCLARNLLRNNQDLQITGIDAREFPKGLASRRLKFQRIRYNRSQFEKVFRNNQFDYVFHLSRLSHGLPKANIMERSDVNVVGTNTILELCYKHKVKKVIVLSTFHVYGANPDNPFFIPESYPLRASFRYHELHDVVEMDQSTTSFMWRHRSDLDTIILRPCNIIGPHIRNAMSRFLARSVGFVPIDYKPMLQFIHEADLAKILSATLMDVPSGIYNVGPRDTISLQRISRIVGKLRIPAPIGLMSSLSEWTGANLGIPSYLFDYLKHSCVIDTGELSQHLGEGIYEYSSEAAIANTL